MARRGPPPNISRMVSLKVIYSEREGGGDNGLFSTPVPKDL